MDDSLEKQERIELLELEVEELRRGISGYRAFFQNSTDNLMLLDRLGNVVLANDRCMDIFGIPADEIAGKSIFEFLKYIKLSRYTLASMIRIALEGRPPKRGTEVECVHADGHPVFIEAYVHVLRENGITEDVLVSVKDVTLRKKEEMVRVGLEEQLQQSQKMEAIGKLAGGVAHDINNVLAGIMATASVLEDNLKNGLPAFDDVHEILESCRRGRGLTGDLLGFARRGQYVREPVSLNELASETSAILMRTISKKVTVEIDLKQHLSFVYGDRSQLIQALVNVCLNALDAMPGRGKLTISTDSFSIGEEERDSIADLDPGEYVNVVVNDTGHGMDRDTQARVFEPFFTTKPKGKGTGLGLSMVYGTVRNHGGDVAIQSYLGQGTTVSIFLPVYEGTVERDSSIPPPPIQHTGHGTILLVDDEGLVRRAGKRMLERLGYSVLTASNGNEAVNVYKREGSDISMVLLDMIMPEMDGYEAFKILRGMNPDVKILLASGYAKDGQVEEILSLGAVGFIAKPYDMKEISERLDEVFLARLSIKEGEA